MKLADKLDRAFCYAGGTIMMILFVISIVGLVILATILNVSVFWPIANTSDMPLGGRIAIAVGIDIALLYGWVSVSKTDK